jgi:hypothetical protein
MKIRLRLLLRHEADNGFTLSQISNYDLNFRLFALLPLATTEAKTNLHSSFYRTCATATCGSPFPAPETAASTSTTSVRALEDSPIFFEPCSLMLNQVPDYVDSLERMQTPTWIPLLSDRAHAFSRTGSVVC